MMAREVANLTEKTKDNPVEDSHSIETASMLEANCKQCQQRLQTEREKYSTNIA